MDFELNEDALQTLAGLAGVAIPAEDVESLLAVLRNQLRLAETLRPLDYSDVVPILSLDPRWR